jgi:predicted nucleic-acid-binding protein
MIGLDTNLLLRLGDDRDPAQKARASALVRAQGQGGSYLNPIVLSEFAWTLRSRYKLTREQIATRIAIVLEAPEFVIAEAAEAARALERYRVGPADFADYFLAEMNRSTGCASTATFDIAALKSGEPFSAVPNLP